MPSETTQFRPPSDAPFLVGMSVLAGAYVLLIVLLVGADVISITPSSLVAAAQSREIRYAFALSMISSTMATILSLWFAVPAGYLLSRYSHTTNAVGTGRRWPLLRRALISFFDAVLDVPLILPPLVVGISLLALFQFAPFRWVSNWVVYEIPAVILAQFTVACAFAVRTMRTTFDQIPIRQEQVAMTLGASRSEAFWQVLLPQARRGMLAAATLCWARSLGEFGPVLIFASSTRMRTEVLPTTVYLEIQSGNLAAALAVSVFLVLVAVVVLIITRLIGWQRFE